MVNNQQQENEQSHFNLNQCTHNKTMIYMALEIQVLTLGQTQKGGMVNP